MQSPYQVVQDFEQALCEYTGAPYAVTTTSCTMALLLACKWHLENPDRTGVQDFEIPSKTYIGVPQSIINAGGVVQFRDDDWDSAYQLFPHPIIDSARWLTSGMYQELQTWEDWKLGNYNTGPFVCCSFQWSKTLSIGQGGGILHNNPEADKWFRKARFDGRTQGVEPKDDDINMIGYHAYMSPRDAAEGLSRLAVLPKHNDPIPNSDYADLSKMRIFQ